MTTDERTIAEATGGRSAQPAAGRPLRSPVEEPDASRVERARSTSARVRGLRSTGSLATLASIAAVVGGLLASAAGAVTITRFPAPADGGVLGIAAGSDGNMWFTEVAGSRVGRITPGGVVTDWSTGSGISTGARPYGITAGPDGNVWFSEEMKDRVARITPRAVATEFPLGATAGGPRGITSGPDGNVWYAADGGAIGRITPAGAVTEFKSGIHPGGRPFAITTGFDGNLWFTQVFGPIGRVTPAGAITEFSQGLNSAFLSGITNGPDGNVWFTAQQPAAIDRVTPAGVITEFTRGLGPGAQPRGITVGPDGNLWFADEARSVIGRVTPAGVIAEFPTNAGPGINAFEIAQGPDGTLWFTESGDTIGRVTFEPEVTTGAAEDVTRLGAFVSGTVTTHFVPGNAMVEYGTTTAYGQATPATALPLGEAPQPVSATLSGLKPGTTYHYRILARSAAGTGVGPDRTVVTLPDGSTSLGRGSPPGGGTGGSPGSGSPGGTRSGPVPTAATGGSTVPKLGKRRRPKILTRHAIVRPDGTFKVVLRCPATAVGGCPVRLRILTRAAAGQSDSVATRRFRLPSGTTRAVGLRLSAAAAARLRRRGHLSTIAKVANIDRGRLTAEGGALTLTLASTVTSG